MARNFMFLFEYDIQKELPTTQPVLTVAKK